MWYDITFSVESEYVASTKNVNFDTRPTLHSNVNTEKTSTTKSSTKFKPPPTKEAIPVVKPIPKPKPKNNSSGDNARKQIQSGYNF